MGYKMTNDKPMLKTDMYLEVGKPWSMSTLSKMVGVTTNKVKKMMDEGLPYHMDGNVFLFDSKEAVRWIIRHEVNNSLPDFSNNENKISALEARRRYDVARALQAELALAKEREQLANIDDILENVGSALSQVRAKLISQPARLSGILAHQEEGFISDTLEQDIIEVLEGLSRYQHEYIEHDTGGEEEDRGENKPAFPTVPIAPTKIKPG